MPWTRASELARAIACPASVVLPRVPDLGSRAAAFGTELHAWKAGGAPSKSVTTWLTHQEPKWLNREVMWPGGQHEVLLGVSEHDARRYAGTKEQNAYERSLWNHTWVAGEADWVQWDLPWVTDLKTGWHPGRPSLVVQLRTYGLAVARVLQEPVVLLSIDHWPRYPLGTPPTRVTEPVLRADLETWWTEVVEPARVEADYDPATTTDLDKHPGAHCKFCRAECEHRC